MLEINFQQNEELKILQNNQRQWFWLFIVNGVRKAWSNRFFTNREGCVVDASQKGVLIISLST